MVSNFKILSKRTQQIVESIQLGVVRCCVYAASLLVISTALQIFTLKADMIIGNATILYVRNRMIFVDMIKALYTVNCL